MVTLIGILKMVDTKGKIMNNAIIKLHDDLALASVQFAKNHPEFILFLKENYPMLYEYYVSSETN